MKEYLKIYIGDSSNVETTFLDIYDKLRIACRDINWNIQKTAKVLEHITNPKNWYPEFCINFDKDNKIISVGINRKPGFTAFNCCLLEGFKNENIDRDISALKKYMLFNGNSRDYSFQPIISKNDYINSFIERFKSDRHIKYVTLYHIPQLLSRIANRVIDNNTIEASRLQALFNLNEDKNIISINPKSFVDAMHISIITDNIFKEIFGAKSGDFIKASNCVMPDISVKDSLQSNLKFDYRSSNARQYLHINGKIIHDAEFLQMADIGFDQLIRLLRNVDDLLSYDNMVCYNYGDNERNISFFVKSNNYNGEILGELYTINIKRNNDPYYKPLFSKYELLLTEENELKLIKK